MASTIPQAFTEFEGKLALTDYEQGLVEQRRNRVEEILKGLYPMTSDMPLSGLYVIGSARRATMIRPIGDIDLFSIFDDTNVWLTYQSDSRKLLYRARDALNKSYRTTIVGSRGQAVRLFYTQPPHVDIAPAFPVNGSGLLGGVQSYLIPKGDGQWEQTAPFQHTDFLSQRNQELGSQLKPLTRILKRWNALHSARIGSFHLELIVQAVFSTIGTNRSAALRLFFEQAPNRLDQLDPAGFSGNLAAGWTYQHRQAVSNSLLTASNRAAKAVEAQAQGDVAEASRLWRIILGADFPAL